MGHTIAVDDLGTRADHSDGCLGAHLVCHLGEYGNDETNNDKSPLESPGAFTEKCIVHHAVVTVRAPFDGR